MLKRSIAAMAVVAILGHAPHATAGFVGMPINLKQALSAPGQQHNQTRKSGFEQPAPDVRLLWAGDNVTSPVIAAVC